MFITNPDCLNLQGHSQCHQEAVGRCQRHLLLHPRHLWQASPRAAQEGVCQVLKEVLKHSQGILQRGTVSHLELVHSSQYCSKQSLKLLLHPSTHPVS